MKKSLLLISFILSMFWASGQAQNFRIKIDSLLTYLYENNLFSGRVVLQKGDQIIYTGDYDRFQARDHESGIGSISKVFTAIIIYQLIDEGKLAIDTRIDRFFPEIPYSDQISIEQLLSHTSGIFSITDWDQYYASRNRHFDREEILSIIGEHKPAFKPGKDCVYSNSNFVLLGYIIEDLTALSYADNVKNRIAIPLNLQQSYCRTGVSEGPFSYKYDGEKWEKDVDSDPSFPGAAGAMISTAEDMAAMINALFSGKLISDSSLRIMKKTINKSTGHGIFRTPYYNRSGWGHSGRIDEFRAFINYFPDDSLILSITSNGMLVNLNDVLLAVLGSYYDKAVSYPPVYAFEGEAPDKESFTGIYTARLFGLIPVGKLRISAGGGSCLLLSEYKEGVVTEHSLLERNGACSFHSRASGGDIIFTPGKKGITRKAVLVQGKIKIRCRRTGS